MRTLYLAFVLLLAAGCSSTHHSDWATFRAGPFIMDMPKDFRQLSVTTRDSYIGEFQNKSMLLRFDYGLSSNNFEDWPKATEYQLVTINDFPARIGTVHQGFLKGYAYSTQVAFRETGGKFLSVTVAGQTEADVALARKIFFSIKFKPSAPH